MKQSMTIPAKILDDFLAGIQLNGEMLDEPARTAGWSKAEPRKITLPQLLVALSLESMQGQASFNDLSAAPVSNSKKTTSSCATAAI